MRIAISLLLMLVVAAGAGADTAAYTITNPGVMQKVQPTAQDAGPVAKSLYIAMARGEYEPVQIVVTAGDKPLKGVRVDASKLRGPDGFAIPSQRVVVTPIACVRCSVVSDGAPMKGLVPDVLLSNRAVDIAAGQRQSFYITVRTVVGDAPGEYRGFVRVTADGAPSTLIPLTVRVYAVTLPTRSHLRTGFALWGYFAQFDPALKDNRKLWLDAYMRYAKLMLSYRISPIAMWRPTKSADGVYDFSEFDRLLSELIPEGLNTLNIGENWLMAVNADTEWAKAAEKHFKERGVWDMTYVYGLDEAAPDRVGTLVNNYKALVGAVPDLKIMQTGWNPNPALKDLVKIWCPLTQNADLNALRAARDAGEETWWYVCCVPVAPYANVFIDYPGVDQRILGWMTYKEGIQGFLYWAVDMYAENKGSLDSYVDASFTNWQTCSFANKNSDGILIYPGKNGTPIPSMRLALLRDGFEDYDLFTEVSALAASRPGPAADRAKKLLTFDAPLIKSLTEYTKNGSDLLARREAVLKVAEEMVSITR